MRSRFEKKQARYKIADKRIRPKQTSHKHFSNFKNSQMVQEHFANKMWCAKCGSTQNLTFDHIKPRGRYPELTRQLDNLQILCLFKCHAFKTSIEKTDWFDNDKFLRGDYDK